MHLSDPQGLRLLSRDLSLDLAIDAELTPRRQGRAVCLPRPVTCTVLMPGFTTRQATYHPVAHKWERSLVIG